MAWQDRWRNVFRTEELNGTLDDELQFHLSETVDRLVAHGTPKGDALREARLRLGNYSLQKERTRDMNISLWLDSLRADTVYGWRQLRLSPGFAAIAVLSLALGIGANTAMFQLVNAIRLKMLPVNRPEQLAYIDFQKGSTRGGWWSSRSANFTSLQYDQIRQNQRVFQDVFAWSAARFNLANGGEPRWADGAFVSGNFFHALGVNAVRGRLIEGQDDTASCTGAAVVSYAFWQRELGGDPNVTDHFVTLNNIQMPVVGVTSPAFFGPEVGYQYDVLAPLCADQGLSDDKKGRAPNRSAWWLSLMGRLRPDQTVQSATNALHVISPLVMRESLPTEYRPDMAKRFLANKLEASESSTGVSNLRKNYERPLWVLLAITGLVLLIACANLANLLLARAAVREPEIAVRLAIGVSRARLVRQLLVESLLLAVAGTVLGSLLAIVLSRGLIAFLSTADDPIFVNMSLDWRMFAFTGALAVVTCLAFGLLPALRAAFVSPILALRSGGRSVTSGRERFSLRRALVLVQVALSLTLLVGALLFVRSLHNLMTTDAGFQAEGVLTVSADFSRARLTADQALGVRKRFGESLAGIPGVASVAEVGFTPVSGGGWNNTVGPDNSPAAGSGKDAYFNRVSPGYFKTMGTQLIVGREFNDRDTASGSKVAIVNKLFADKYFGGANPVGHTFHLEQGANKQEPVFQVVGMVSNTKYYELREDFMPLGFFPIAQDEKSGFGGQCVVRLVRAPGPFMRSAKTLAAKVSPLSGIEFHDFSQSIRDSLMRERLLAILSGGFGFLAGTLATLGLYGVIAYMVARRRSEIGVRIALGADRGRVIWLVLSEAVGLLGIGIALGIGLSLWAGRVAETMLYGLKPQDPISLLGASGLLLAVALLASYIPARRAARLDPAIALRNE